jgi:CubicO group peptidase (beta-lactamase class C family)
VRSLLQVFHREDNVFLAKGCGYADLALQTPVDLTKTAFRAGSVSKLFTWTAVMQVAERSTSIWMPTSTGT